MINQEEEDKRSKGRGEDKKEENKRAEGEEGRGEKKDGPKIRMFNHKLVHTFYLENVTKEYNIPHSQLRLGKLTLKSTGNTP